MAVCADEPFDQFMRSLPLVVLPMVMRTNMDLLFGTFAIFFYGTAMHDWSRDLVVVVHIVARFIIGMCVNVGVDRLWRVPALGL